MENNKKYEEMETIETAAEEAGAEEIKPEEIKAEEISQPEKKAKKFSCQEKNRSGRCCSSRTGDYLAACHVTDECGLYGGAPESPRIYRTEFADYQ